MDLCMIAHSGDAERCLRHLRFLLLHYCIISAEYAGPERLTGEGDPKKDPMLV